MVIGWDWLEVGGDDVVVCWVFFLWVVGEWIEVGFVCFVFVVVEDEVWVYFFWLFW